MSKNIEIESKTLLDQPTYKALCQAFTAKKEFIQQNFYFDTPDFNLINNYSSIRIRIFSDHAEQTLKTKETSQKQDKYHEVVEINDDLSIIQAKQMIQAAQAGIKFSFGGDVGSYLANHFSKEIVQELKLTTWSKTKRILAVGPQECELTLDLTEYEDGYADYELEIENDDSKLIKNVLATLEKQFNFQSTHSNTNKNKVQRAYQHAK